MMKVPRSLLGGVMQGIAIIVLLGVSGSYFEDTFWARARYCSPPSSTRPRQRFASLENHRHHPQLRICYRVGGGFAAVGNQGQIVSCTTPRVLLSRREV